VVARQQVADVFEFLESHLRSIFVYSLDTSRVSPSYRSFWATRGISVFNKDGRSFFLAASTDVGLSSGWLDLFQLPAPGAA